VRGELDLVRGELRFDPARGAVAGEIVVDATSARTGIGARDRDMHERVLESARFPEITLRAERLEVLRRDEASADVRLHATLEIHGAAHPVAIPARVTALAEDRLLVEAAFRVPYVAWGMHDPSTFVLRVAKEVDVSVRAEATRANRVRKRPGRTGRVPGCSSRASTSVTPSSTASGARSPSSS
jgi:polyisoprenoid-binding protein YceI